MSRRPANGEVRRRSPDKQQPAQQESEAEGSHHKQREEGIVHAAEDSRWAEDWSEDVERTYDAPPPLDLTRFDLELYRRLVRHYSRAGVDPEPGDAGRGDGRVGPDGEAVDPQVEGRRLAGDLPAAAAQRQARRPAAGRQPLPPEGVAERSARGGVPADGNEGSRHPCCSQRGITAQVSKAPGRNEGSRRLEIPRWG
jgi:hypothetical protein